MPLRRYMVHLQSEAAFALAVNRRRSLSLGLSTRSTLGLGSVAPGSKVTSKLQINCAAITAISTITGFFAGFLVRAFRAAGGVATPPRSGLMHAHFFSRLGRSTSASTSSASWERSTSKTGCTQRDAPQRETKSPMRAAGSPITTSGSPSTSAFTAATATCPNHRSIRPSARRVWPAST